MNKHIRDYWIYEFDGNTMPNSGIMVPDGFFELIFIEGILPEMKLINKSLNVSNAFVIGQLEYAPQIVPMGPFRMIGVKIYPWALSMFTELPMNWIRNRQVDIEDLWGSKGTDLKKQVLSTRNFEIKRNCIERFFTEQQNQSRNNPLMNEVCQKLYHNSHSVTISEIVGTNQRYLERKFQERIGLSLKKLQRILRIRSSVEFIRKGISISETASVLGYYDLAHFNRDFKTLIGMAPRKFYSKRNFISTDLLKE